MIRLILWIKPFAKYMLATLVITILTVSSIPSIPTLKIHTANSEIRLDYLIHFCEYGLLAFISFLTFVSDRYILDYRKYIFIFLSLIAFAMLDEFHQKYIPGRAFNVKDIVSNIAGIIAALIFCLTVFRIIGNRYLEQ